MHCGYHRAGLKGLFLGGLSFILPAVAITLAIAISYEHIQSLRWTDPIISGIKAAVISFIIGAVYKLGKKAIKDVHHWIIGLVVVVAAFYGVNEIILILTAGLVFLLFRSFVGSAALLSIAPLPLFFLSLSNYTHLKLFLVFLKVGLVLFGSGYVLFAYLDGELIDGLSWLSHETLVEAIAVGQMTPGPVLSTATFIGYKVGGLGGALLATVGIFLPSFFYVWGLNRFIHKFRSNQKLKFFLEAVNVAAVSVMLVVCVKMGQSIIIDWRTGLICLLSFGLYFGFRGLSTLWIIVLGAVMGYALSFL